MAPFAIGNGPVAGVHSQRTVGDAYFEPVPVPGKLLDGMALFDREVVTRIFHIEEDAPQLTIGRTRLGNRAGQSIAQPAGGTASLVVELEKIDLVPSAPLSVPAQPVVLLFRTQVCGHASP